MHLVMHMTEPYNDTSWRGLPNSIIRSIDQCMSMSDAALRYGCDIDSSFAHKALLPNPLFTMVDEGGRVVPPPAMMEALQYLCNIWL